MLTDFHKSRHCKDTMGFERELFSTKMTKMGKQNNLIEGWKLTIVRPLFLFEDSNQALNRHSF